MSDPAVPVPPAGTTELGIDIIRVERIVKALQKHGRRFPLRILTPAEDAYVRDRPGHRLHDLRLLNQVVGTWRHTR